MMMLLAENLYFYEIKEKEENIRSYLKFKYLEQWKIGRQTLKSWTTHIYAFFQSLKIRRVGV